MSNERMSKMDMRSAVVAFSIVAMLVVSFGFKSADAAASPVSLSSDISSADVMEGEYVIATLTVTNSDNTYRKMEIKLTANFPGGTAWSTMFLDTDNNPIDDDMVALGKQDSTTVRLAIFCDGVCSAGDTNTVQVYGQTDPRWYPGGSGDPETCGSSDCETDTTPASSSSNVTNTV